ncbi:MAG: IS1634 family transposase, partial [Ignavibacteria bacterium]|nr:IS1634 family transposase [Ignavibacteria bacterium]
ESHRVKVADGASGKTRGTGLSKIKTKEIYLGTAESILEKVKGGEKPLSVNSKAFGVECAALSIIDELGIIQIIDKFVPKRDQGHSIGQYLAVAAINRLSNPTSRSGIADWLEGTVLPEKMGIDSGLFSSQNFWDAFDKVLSEAEAKSGEEKVLGEIHMAGIEEAIWRKLTNMYKLDLDTVIYDTTNFYTYIDPLNERSELSRFAHSKDGKKDLKHVGLILGVTEKDDLPLFHRVYAANIHDAKLFPESIRKIMDNYSMFKRGAKNCTLIMDKGNNSEDNIKLAVEHKCRVIGSLVPSHHEELMRKNLASYRDEVDGVPVYRTEKDVFGMRCAVAVTYNESLKARKTKTFDRNVRALIDSIEKELEKRYASTKEEIEKAIGKLLKNSHYGRYVIVDVNGRRYKNGNVSIDIKAVREKKRTFGKNIIFSTDPLIRTAELVRGYKKRNKIEDVFKLTKDSDIIAFRPMYCWTDSKIRVYAFICVLALLILKLLSYKAKQAGLEMSEKVLVTELSDIRQVALVFSTVRVTKKIEDMSTIQQELFAVFRLDRYSPE